MGGGQSHAMQAGWDKGTKEDQQVFREFIASQLKVGATSGLGLAGGNWTKKGDGGDMEKYFDKHKTTPEDPQLEQRILTWYGQHAGFDPDAHLIVLSTAFSYDQGSQPPGISQAIMFSQMLDMLVEPINKVLKKQGEKICIYNPNKYNNGHPGWCQVYKTMLNWCKESKGFMIQPVGTISGGGYRGATVQVDAAGSGAMKGGSQSNEKDMALKRGIPVYTCDLSKWMNNPGGWDGSWVEQYNFLVLKRFILEAYGGGRGGDEPGKWKADKIKGPLQESMMTWEMAMMCDPGKAKAAWDRQFPQVFAAKYPLETPKD